MNKVIKYSGVLTLRGGCISVFLHMSPETSQLAIGRPRLQTQLINPTTDLRTYLIM